MDDHTTKVVAGLMMYTFEGVNWEFERLSFSEKQIIGNQVQLDIIRRFVDKEFEKAMAK